MTLNELLTININNEARPSRADAVKNRQTLLEAAARLFAERGVEAVTMSEIAQAAHVGKGTLYRHFANKTALCHALLDHEQRELQQRTFARLNDRTASPRETLEWFLAEVAAFVWHNLPLLYVIGDARAPLPLDNPAHRWWRQTIRALLSRCGASGDIEYWTETLYVMVDVAALRCQRDTRGFDLDRVTRGLLALLDRILAAT